MRHVGPEVQRASNHGSPAESDTTVYYNCTLCTSNLSLPQHCQAAPFHNVDKFQNLNKKFKIWTKFQNLDQKFRFRPNFRISIKIKHANLGQDIHIKIFLLIFHQNISLGTVFAVSVTTMRFPPWCVVTLEMEPSFYIGFNSPFIDNHLCQDQHQAIFYREIRNHHWLL